MVHLIESGDIPSGGQLMENHNVALRQAGKNLIRQAQDRAVDIEPSGGEFVEGFVSGKTSFATACGTFSPTDRTALILYDDFSTINDSEVYNNIKISAGLSDEAPGDVTFATAGTPENAFDGDLTTGANSAGGYVGKTFSAKTVDYAYFRAYGRGRNSGSGGGTKYTQILLETYDGSVWTSVSTTTSSSGTTDNVKMGVSKLVTIGTSIQGIRVRIFNGMALNNEGIVYALEYGSMNTAGTDAKFSIPTGTNTTTISSSFATVLHEDWESGSNVQYKLTGSSGAEDTGWLETNEVSEFTAFTAEPDTLIVKLIPKTTSPTAGYPSIKGVSVFE